MFFQKKPKNEVEKSTIGTNPTIEELCHFFNIDNISDIGGNLTSATYYAAMQIRCNALAKLPFKIMQHDDKNGDIVLRDHPLYDLLKFRPNPCTNAHDFLWATEFQRLEYGDAFWIKDFRGGKINALYLLKSENVSIIVDDRAILGEPNCVYYQYGDAIYREEEVCHFKNYSLNGIKGTSIKKYLQTIIDQEKYGQNVVREKYKNGLQDPIVVTFTGDLDDTRQSKIQKKFASMGGAKNAGKVIPIPAEFDVKMLETKLVNSQFFQLNGLTTRHIANAFGVKSFQLNDMEKSTYSNIEQQNRAFYSDTLQNVVTEYEQETTYKLLSTADRSKGIYTHFNVDALLRSDILTRYQAYQIAINSGFKMISEVRATEGDTFVDGTDRLIIGNGASIPLSDIGKQYNKGG